MKFCPKCGNKNSQETRFCTKCGYQFDKQTSKGRFQKAKIKVKGWIWLFAIIVFIIIGGGFWLFQSNNHDSAVAKNNSSNTATVSSASEYHEANTRTKSSSTNEVSDNSTKLSFNLGPKETAAAIAYYADKSGLDGWHGYLEGNNGIIVVLDDSDDNLNLSKDGQGMSYGVLNKQRDYIGVTKNIYTIDQDNTINIYRLSDKDNPDNPVEPIRSVSKDEIIQYLNNHGYASDVKSLSKNITIDQSNLDM